MSRAFSSLDGLLRLSRTGGVDIRPPLLRVITDLFVQGSTHTREEIQQYAELSLRLLPVVDDKTREAVVAKLQGFPGTPIWLLLQARRFLKREAASETAPNGDAGIDPARSTPADKAAPAVASESTRTETIFSAIDDPFVAVPAPAMEATAPISPARPLSAAPTRSLGERFLRGDTRERLALLIYSYDAPEPAVEADIPLLRFPAPTVERLEFAARERDPRRFARELQQAFGISSRIASEIAHDDTGEALLVVAKATAMPSEVLLRVLLLLNPKIGESVQIVFRLYRLYEAIDSALALRVVASWRDDSNARPKAQFQSFHADETPSRARIWDSFRSASQSRTEQPGARPLTPGAPAKSHGTT